MNLLVYKFGQSSPDSGLGISPYAFSYSIAMLYKAYVNTLFLQPSGRAQLWPMLDRIG